MLLNSPDSKIEGSRLAKASKLEEHLNLLISPISPKFIALMVLMILGMGKYFILSSVDIKSSWLVVEILPTVF